MYLGTAEGVALLTWTCVGPRTCPGTGHFQLSVLVVGLVWQQHADLAPPVEEQDDSCHPDHQHQNYNCHFHPSYLQHPHQVLNFFWLINKYIIELIIFLPIWDHSAKSVRHFQYKSILNLCHNFNS